MAKAENKEKTEGKEIDPFQASDIEMPKDPKDPEGLRKRMVKCKVVWSEAYGEDRYILPIPVNDMDGSRKPPKHIMPDTLVELTEVEVRILEQAVSDVQIPIPMNSGIMRASDPVKFAKDYYPGFEIEGVDFGRYYAVRKVPRFYVMRLG